MKSAGRGELTHGSEQQQCVGAMSPTCHCCQPAADEMQTVLAIRSLQVLMQFLRRLTKRLPAPRAIHVHRPISIRRLNEPAPFGNSTSISISPISSLLDKLRQEGQFGIQPLLRDVEPLPFAQRTVENAGPSVRVNPWYNRTNCSAEMSGSTSNDFLP